VLAGSSQPTDATPSDFSLIRLNADGSLDTTFSVDGKLMIPMTTTDLGYSVIQQADGKLVMAGESGFSFGVIRVHADGTLDQTFSGDGLQRLSLDSNRNDAYSVVQQADGKLVVVARHRNGDTERELTVKRLRLFRDRMELQPQSKNPHHEAIVFSLPARQDEEAETRIIAVVLSATWIMT
jgi:uncharacterized delta-60 repeat protein